MSENFDCQRDSAGFRVSGGGEPAVVGTARKGSVDGAQPSGQDLCIPHLLGIVAEQAATATAIGAPGRTPLSYDRLLLHVHEVRETLNAMGVGRNDRVALVVPNGPEMAVAFVAVAASATCAPLNPSYRASEFDFYLSDLAAKALIIQSGMDSPALAVARQRGIAIIELVPDESAEAGIFTLSGGTHPGPISPGFAEFGDAALVLYTSGTTARPKMVRLTHTNICTSARNIAASLELSPRDRCLNVMPLYHIHGLIGGVLSTLTAGASMICPPGFAQGDFFAWIEEFHPTWYTAVPTIHQAILERAADFADIIRRCPLRLIRSCSAPMPSRVLAELEHVFGAPVIEAYGMTEASHQISSNPLPPRPSKEGSVGVTTGPEVAIMDEGGALLPWGAIGEIVIRGPTVIRGYEDNPAANATAFTAGWFRTGDQGVVDPDGYLFIRGRLKEIINRGGAKISPREVEEVLLDHPAVAQAVVFGLPHPTLGEDVAAATVLRKDASATETDIRQFVTARLADFKVPRRIVIVEDIPKGATGKVQRAQLAALLGPQLKTQFVAPSSPLEWQLAGIWATVLGLKQVGVHDNFFEIGGTSLAAVRVFAEVQRISGRNLPLATLLQAATVRQLAEVLSTEESSAPWPSLVAIQPHGSRPPFFCMHAIGGNVLYYRDLAHHLGPDQPFYALQQQGFDGIRPFHTRIEDMAAHYVEEIQAFQPEGPYFLGGHSFGGLVAYEVARRLTTRGQKVALLGLIDTYFPDASQAYTSGGPEIAPLLRRIAFHVENLMELRPRDKLGYILERVESLARRLMLRLSLIKPRAPYPHSPALGAIKERNRRMTRAYVPLVYPDKVTVFLTPRDSGRDGRDPRIPKTLAAGGVEVHRVPGDHLTVMNEPGIRILAEKLRTCLDTVCPQRSGTSRSRLPGTAAMMNAVYATSPDHVDVHSHGAKVIGDDAAGQAH